MLLAAPVAAQVAPPHAGYVYPAGGRQGTTVDVRIGGEHLNGPTSLTVSGEGVRARVVDYARPLTQREIAALRKKIQDLEEKEDKSTADFAEIAALKKKIEPPVPRPTPAVAEVVTLQIEIGPKAAPGPRQLRLVSAGGASNPLVFHVGRLPEVAQQKALVDPEASHPPTPAVAVTLPAVLNSQMLAGTVDRWRFEAKKGQQLVFVARARALIPYLADAVPGWFQAALTLYGPDGKEVAFSDHFHHQPDPVLAHKVARDGAYVLEVKDALYRGREDFVYRIEAGELPFITSIYPLGGRAYTRTTVELEGWNLPGNTLTLDTAEMKPGLISLSARAGEWTSNSVPFAVSGLAEATKAGPIASPGQAQPITLPVVVNGRIDQPGAWDVYKFEGSTGEVVVAEVVARRLGSPLDSRLKLTDEAGRVVAFNDDWEDKSQGLVTHHADSLIRATLPAKGVYYLHVGDAQGRGGPANGYRLRVSHPRPDFELRVTPCSINAQPGSTAVVTVHAVRRDGFNGEIELHLVGAPKEYALTGAKVPAGQDSVRLTLQVPPGEKPTPTPLVVEGRADAGGQRVTRVAVPVEDMMQAFAYHHLVTANELLISVSGKARPRFPAQLLVKGPAKLRAGGSVQVRVLIARPASAGKIQLALSDPPEGITLKGVEMHPDGAVLTIAADGEKVMPGQRGNLIVEAFPEASKGQNRGAALGTLPAIPYEVLKVNR